MEGKTVVWTRDGSVEFPVVREEGGPPVFSGGYPVRDRAAEARDAESSRLFWEDTDFPFGPALRPSGA